MKKPIGIYDSGIGGLSVLKAMQKQLPGEDFVYFADTAHLPYGDKSPAQIMAYSRRIISWLQDEKNVKLVVSACHTSSAIALEPLRKDFQVPIIGMIAPFLRVILNGATYHRIGIIATPTSVASRGHEKHILQSGFKGKLLSIACPKFVPFIESGAWETEAFEAYARQYLSVFESERLDTLIYGCSHYPFIRSVIERILPSHMQFIDPTHHVALAAVKLLTQHKRCYTHCDDGHVQFYCSKDPQDFADKVGRLAHKVFLPSILP